MASLGPDSKFSGMTTASELEQKQVLLITLPPHIHPISYPELRFLESQGKDSQAGK